MNDAINQTSQQVIDIYQTIIDKQTTDFNTLLLITLSYLTFVIALAAFFSFTISKRKINNALKINTNIE